MIIDKPGYYKTRDGRKREVEYVGKDYAIARTENGDPVLYELDGAKTMFPGGPGDIISPWTDPPKPLECWVNVYKDCGAFWYQTEDDARNCARPEAIRIAVHMREVRD